ncbi:MAG: alpha/beta fold hydrolase, partial [Victivallales bacterium]|nr:alpha/beta fold hydrolase [Victivallales bacterium]
MKKLSIPSTWSSVEWHGFTRHDFEFAGCKAFVVEPHYPAGDGRWSWCTVWPEAFVRRVGIELLLEHGFYHVHVDAFAYRANPQGVAIMKSFHDFLVEIGLSPKANLIGMSWGGFFALRYSETHPDDVAALYLDAPLCNAADGTNPSLLGQITEAFGMTQTELETSPRNPICNVEPLVAHKIPMMAVV